MTFSLSTDAAFGPEKSTSPLESALSFLEAINRETSIPQQDFENVCTSLKEMVWYGIFNYVFLYNFCCYSFTFKLYIRLGCLLTQGHTLAFRFALTTFFPCLQIVVIFIKNNKFDEAKMVLNTHFPKQMIGKVSSVIKVAC